MVSASSPSPVLLGRWHITDHARDQYRAKYAPHLSAADAFRALVTLSERAHLVCTLPDGQQRWRGPRPLAVRCLVDPRVPDGKRPQLVTVLDPYLGAAEESKPAGPVELSDFADVPGHPGKRSRLACRICLAPILTLTARQSTCGKEACRAEHTGQIKAWRWHHDPAYRQRVESGWRDWADDHREQVRAGSRDRMRASRARAKGQEPADAPPAPAPALPADPWAAASPEAGTHLPGAWRELVFDPTPHTPIPHSHASSLHGVVSTALGRDHDRTDATFVLSQARVPSGWGVYFVDGADARRLSCAPMPGLHLERRPWGICFGPGVVTPRRPSAVAPGRYTVTVTSLTPVSIRRTVDGQRRVRVTPTAAGLRSTLTGLEFLRRAGLASTKAPAWARDVALVLIGHDTRRESAEVCGHWMDDDGRGRIVGWTGTVTLEVNAVALWLLRHAEIVGLGGRVGLGFGQVRVSLTP